MIEDFEKDADVQRAEMAQHLGLFRDSIRLSSITRDLADGSKDLGASLGSLVARNPVPLALAGTVILLFVAHRRRRAGRSIHPTPMSAVSVGNEPAVPQSSSRRRPTPSSIIAKIGQAAEEVFDNWVATVSASIEQFALEITRQVAQSLVRAGDTLIASGFERLAKSLSQSGR